MAHKEIGLDRLAKIAEDLSDISKVESPPKHVGRRVLLMLAPDKPKVELVKRKLEAVRAREEAMKKGEAAPSETPEQKPDPADEDQAEPKGDGERQPSPDAAEESVASNR